MTNTEKTTIASFLDLSLDFLTTGYHAERSAPHFESDAVSGTTDNTTGTEGGMSDTKGGMSDTKGGMSDTTDSVSGTKGGMSDTTGGMSGTGGRVSGTTDNTSGTTTLSSIADEIALCRACGLCGTRRKAVPGEGASAPLAMVVGEAPGADEDATGRPFVGAAGQLLDRMLAAIELSRETNCFIANVLKCRPPGNRDPAPDEREACLPFLARQISALRPKAILCVGRVPAQALLGVEAPMRALRGGKRWDYAGPDGADSVPLFATYHPSAILRYPQDYRQPAWDDLKAFRAFLDAML
jgi:DNA polymerase